MKLHNTLAKAFFGLMLLHGLTSCQCNIEPDLMSPYEFDRHLIHAQHHILDVRTKNEFQNGHIHGARLSDVSDPNFGLKLLRKHIPKSDTLLIYDYSGMRAVLAYQILGIWGYRHRKILKGGLKAWLEQTLPLTPNEHVQAALRQGIDLKEYEALVERERIRTIVGFYANWDRKTQRLAKALDSLEKAEHGKVVVLEINANTNLDLVKQKGLQHLPYVEAYEHGKRYYQGEGLGDLDKL